MKLLDRITGQNLSRLPEEMHSGRYLLRQSAVLNRHTPIEAGSLLCADGADHCQLGDIRLPFASLDAALDARGELFADAITTIAGLMSEGGERPSPLIPTGMISKQSRVTPLEQMLCAVLKGGHLHSISARPRIDLKYEESVTDVSRARRLTNSTYTHLASHSECWQRQTLSGIQPRRVLARFSEDDYGTYENCVYARLLDGLDNYLTRRLRRMEALRADLEQTLNLTGSKDLHFLLNREICSLWGPTYDAEQTKKQLKAAQDTLEMIAIQLQNIRGLKQSGLYLLVGRSSRVGIALHRTNVLSHDQHYRHVALLWDELHHTNELASRTPAETFEANQQLELNYSRYIGLVLRNALIRYGFEAGNSMLWAGHQLQILQCGLDWHLMVDGVAVLELVPWACLDELPSDLVQDKAFRVLCWPGIELGDALGSAITGAALRLSPMDLYTVERMGGLVDQSLTGFLLSHYGKLIQPLPGAVVAEVQQVKGLKVQGNGLQVFSPLGDDIAARVRELLAKHARPELSQAFMGRIAEARALSLCPVCDAPAELIAQTDGGFSSSCRSCSCKRYLRKEGAGHWDYQQILSGRHEFRITGRRSMVLSLRREV